MMGHLWPTRPLAAHGCVDRARNDRSAFIRPAFGPQHPFSDPVAIGWMSDIRIVREEDASLCVENFDQVGRVLEHMFCKSSITRKATVYRGNLLTSVADLMLPHHQSQLNFETNILNGIIAFAATSYATLVGLMRLQA
ncbi:protein of unknown function [Beijerinckiaceae bacterium RH AL1]|nr:protein of unknown function [Beijerinckiaceae bacterium RH CH11]VVB46797.1 protein of unknown function [Beijerinckiaceae bacterium RH AL8]VVC55518.1 protein of unknown function [Beijerinckiaceae bacterium RH AL1]